MINKPGIYDIPADQYHADPCDTPSLSVGMINDLLLAPAKCFANSVRLNPDYEEPEKEDKFTIGTVRHVMFLEPHLFDEKVVVVKFDDWRKAEAKAARDAARDAGKTPILEKHMVKVLAARRAFLANEFVKNAFSDGVFEQSMFWRHPVYGFWCRARPDFVANGRTHMNDYKATTDASPENFGRHAYGLKYHRRAAWYLDGAKVLFGTEPAHYWFINQEVKAPYLPTVIDLDMQAIEAGRMENDGAASLFARCLQTSDWYGYRHRDATDRDRAFRVGLPNYAYMQIDERV